MTDRQAQTKPNIDHKTVAGVGEEWEAFDQRALAEDEWRTLFDNYFSTFPFDELHRDAEGFDLGCGSGRWASGVAPRVGNLHCIDPSHRALDVARKRLSGQANVAFHLAGSDTIPPADGSQDFGYLLGVHHHPPDTQAAMKNCIEMLKPGTRFLVYLSCVLDNRSRWFRGMWRASDTLRTVISRLPFGVRKLINSGLAAGIYWPLARITGASENASLDIARLPLSFYRHSSFYTMQTDALDRFGTRLEHRFSRTEIETMMRICGLTDIRFREDEPYWVACGRKA